VLLHGDFIDKNLLLDGDGYRAVDPTPMTGDPCFDVGFFGAYHPPASGAVDRAVAIATALGYDPNRAIRWTVVWLCHQACETWRADSEELQSLVTARHLSQLLNP
jgi:streptomycin 6-kinase